MRTLSAIGLGVSVLLAIPATARASEESLAVGAKVGSEKVIVVLRSQFAGLPDTPGGAARRSAAVAASQRGVRSELTAVHARGVKSISLVNAVAATVPASAVRSLAADPAVAEVVPDRRIPYGAPAPTPGLPDAAHAIKPLPGACPAKNAVQLNPEAVEVIHAATQSGKGDSAQALGYTGAGVKVAYIADGIDPDNPDFIRAGGQHVFIDKEDFSGTGKNAPTDGGEAFLDASSIAAQGRHVYDVSDYADKLTVPCRIRILGVAPGASLVGLDFIGSSLTVFSSVLLEAIDYAVTQDHVDVINESFGLNKFPDVISTDLIELANDAAVKAGVTVTVASGDAGVTNTISSPATDPHVISVGASTTYRSYAQTGFADITARGVKGWIDNNISGLSSGGYTQTGHTVDVVAPGDLNWALCTPKPRLFFGCETFRGKASPVELEGGTSEAAPLTAGVAALVIQAYEQGHRGQRPTPALIKRIITSTAQDIDAPAEQQGAGMIDAYQAVLAARSYRAAPAAKAGHAVLVSAPQLNAVGGQSASERFTETLTNTGPGPVTVHLSGRTLSPYATIATRTLHLIKHIDKPVRVQFRVPAGQARLNVSLAVNGFANLSLIAPDGDLAEFNQPQGESNLANAQVADPAKGTWTAIVTAEPSGASSTIPAEFLAQTATWRSFGKLSARSLTLAQGASRRFSLAVRTRSVPGDRAGAIVLRTSAGSPDFASQTTIPVTLRTLAATSMKFKATLTGGNGRGPDNGETGYYEINVRPGTPALNVTIRDNRSDPMSAELVSPNGLAESAAGNLRIRPFRLGSGQVTREPGVRLHVTRPGAGKWTLIVDFVNPVSGKATTTPYQVSIDDHATRASQTGLPASVHTKLAAGKPVTAELKITNNAPGTQEYFVDARRAGQVWLTLAPQDGSNLTLPDLNGNVPVYLVPTATTSLAAKVTSSVRNFFDLSWTFGDPDIVSSTGKTSVATFSAPGIPAGAWVATPYRFGPDGTRPSVPVRAHVVMRARTAPLDPTITSPTGDLWRKSTDKKYVPPGVLVKPGQTVTIPVRIDPKGAPGTVVSGTIYLTAISVDPGLFGYNPSLGGIGADNLLPALTTMASFRYAYTVGG